MQVNDKTTRRVEAATWYEEHRIALTLSVFQQLSRDKSCGYRGSLDDPQTIPAFTGRYHRDSDVCGCYTGGEVPSGGSPRPTHNKGTG